MVAQVIGDGYKQTESGLLPKDWEERNLGDVTLSIVSGKSNTKPETGDFPIYGSTGIIGYKRHADYKGKKILVARVGANAGTVNKVDGNYCVSDNTLMVTYKPDVDVDFSYYQLLNYRINRIIFGTGQPLITGSQLRSLRLRFPPTKKEQSAIAKSLSGTDALTESLDLLIEKKKNIKQGAMQELLTGKKRLPGFGEQAYNITGKYQQTEFGEVPKDWKLTQLKNIVDSRRSIRYGIVQPGDFDPNGRYMIRGQDYSEAKGWAKPSEVFRVSDKIEEKYKNARVKTGDIIMTIVGYCGHVEIIPEWLDGANLTQTTARISIDDKKALNKFCKYQLESNLGKLQVAFYLKGAAQPGLNIEDVEKFFLALPSVPEQSAIAHVLSDMDMEIQALEQKRDKYKQLKIGMMQQLLTGRIRLKWKS